MNRTDPTRQELLDSVAVAVLAPSIHNTQPWRFRVLTDGVEVHADPRRQLAVCDPTGRALRVSCGAAVFNLRVGLAHFGYVTETWLNPPDGPDELLARVLTTGRQPSAPSTEALYAAIPRRHSNRAPFVESQVSADVRTRLVAAAKDEGGWLDLVVGPTALNMVAELVAAADRVLVADPSYRAELASWTRPDRTSGDGVPLSAGGPAPAPGDVLVRRDFGGPPRHGHEGEPDPLVGVLSALADSHYDDLVAGQALQRVLLTATQLGLSTSLLSQPIDVPSIREELRLGLRRHGPPELLLRFGRGVPSPGAPRRPLVDVLLPEAAASPATTTTARAKGR